VIIGIDCGHVDTATAAASPVSRY